MTKAFVKVGSNCNPRENLRKALTLLSLKMEITGISPVYLTDDKLCSAEPPYHNCVIKIKTGLTRTQLKCRLLRGIEELLCGRRTKNKSARRTIALDMIDSPPEQILPLKSYSKLLKRQANRGIKSAVKNSLI